MNVQQLVVDLWMPVCWKQQRVGRGKAIRARVRISE